MIHTAQSTAYQEGNLASRYIFITYNIRCFCADCDHATLGSKRQKLFLVLFERPCVKQASIWNRREGKH
jgi:hypothetical protein